MDGADFFAYKFPSACAMPCFREIRVSPKIWVLPSGTFLTNFELRKFCHGKPTVVECDINCDSAKLVFTAPLGAMGDEDVHGTYGMAQTPLVRFTVDLLWIRCTASCTTSCTTN